jgi:hypothetical protein
MKRLTKKDLDFSPQKRALLDRLIQKAGLDSSSLKGIPVRQDRSRAPLSFAQQRIWLINELDPGNPAYNDHFALRLTGSLNLRALEDGLNAIINRHETLRATFHPVNGEPVQNIAP